MINDSQYQIVVVGSGAGGAEAALQAARRGAKGVLLIEKDLLGGSTLHAGTVPIRSLMTSVRMLRQLRVDSDGKSDLNSLSDWRDNQQRAIAKLTAKLDDELRAAGVEIMRGQAILLGEGKVSVAQRGQDPDTERVVNAAQIIIATGARARDPSLHWAESAVGSSSRFVSPTEVPFRLVIIGGGHIGCEFACVYNALGAQVTLIEKGARLLPEMDREAGEHICIEFERIGIRVILSEAARTVWGNVSREFGLAELASNSEELFGDKILVADGRVPNVSGLGLEAAGVEFDLNRGIQVDEFLETTAPGIFAIGDVNGLCTLADAARAQARIAIENALGERVLYSAEEMPRCVHSDPPVAAIGLLEDQARATNVAVRVASERFRAISGPHNSWEWHLVKLIGNPKSRQLLGAMLVGDRALDWIGELGTAISQRCGVLELAAKRHGNESLANALRVCAQRMFGNA